MTYNLLSKYASKNMIGGASTSNATGFFSVLMLSLLFLFIKVFLVHWSYNEVIPNLFPQKYRKITMMESLLLVILVQSLFN